MTKEKTPIGQLDILNYSEEPTTVIIDGDPIIVFSNHHYRHYITKQEIQLEIGPLPESLSFHLRKIK